MPQTKILSLAEGDFREDLIALNSTVHNIDRGFCLRIFEGNPESSNPASHRFILMDGKLVAGTSLIPHTMQWHGSRIKVGEIGLVGTLDEWRERGFSTALMESWIDTMRSENIPLSFLWGIPNFYEKFHYYYALPHHKTPYVVFPRSCSSSLVPTGTIRRAEPSDFWWIRKLYSAYNADLTGCLTRDEPLWDWLVKLTTSSGQASWWVPEDPMGGYALTSGDPPVVMEIAAPSENSLKNLVLGLFRAYPEIDSLGFRHHPGMPVGQWLYHWGARISSVEDIWEGTWGGMVRILDLPMLFQNMTSKLESRLSKSRFLGFSGHLPIQCEAGSADLIISSGKVSVSEIERGCEAITIPASVLTPLLTGYRGFERFRSAFADLSPEICDLLSALFPRDLAYIYPILYVDEYFSMPE